MPQVESQPAEAVVQEHLEQVLASPFFKTSKRCSSMLRYITEYRETHSDDALKERMVGTAVFGRDPDYDTSIDPVVRATAGEIRKRLAQYYGEKADHEVIISLPPGSYLPSLLMRSAAQESSTEVAAPLVEPSNQADLVRATLSTGAYWRWAVAIAATAILLIAFAVALWARPTPQERFWKPFLAVDNRPVICLGDEISPATGQDPTPTDHVATRESDGLLAALQLSDVVAANNISSYLAARKRTSTIINSGGTSFVQLREHPAILVGGLTNRWSVRAMKATPLRILRTPNSRNRSIVDHAHPDTPLWAIDLDQPIDQVDRVYALIARFRDPGTNQMTMMVAGTGSSGTVAGASFLTTPSLFEEFFRTAPHDWEQKNLELVVEAPMVRGDLGTPHLLRSLYW